jgi:hypothetical protein
MKPFPPPPAIDLLEQFIDAAKQRLAQPATPKQRLEMFWSFAMTARDIAAEDVWREEFQRLAAASGLTAHPKIRQDGIDHVLRWAWLKRNPFR